jgi:catechol 2,3-dioxygenase-like lactoylglutathione lyase family enzyme
MNITNTFIGVTVCFGCLTLAAQESSLPIGGVAERFKQLVPARAVSSLTKPSLEVCLNTVDAEQATKFFAEGLGLSARGEPRGGASGVAMRMLLFTAGQSTVKVRVYQQPPAKLPADIAARNGLRLLSIPVEKLDDVVTRLRRLGFEVTDAKQADELRWAMARNADGTAFELIEATANSAQCLEIGLVVPDLSKARDFFTGVYGAKELPETTSRVLPGEKELRFTTGGTIFKCWAPAGDRESDKSKIPELLGFRYVTHNVRDTQSLHNALTAKGVEIATPMASHLGVANLFMARGPGGVLMEFISFGKTAAAVPSKAGTPPQSKQRPAAAVAGAGASDALFKRLDKNGDGKLSAQELPNAERFKKLDANADGFISPEELKAGFAADYGGGATPVTKPSAPSNPNAPEANLPKDRPFLGLHFDMEYFAAVQPAGRALAKATEANALVPHQGRLYCATSYMPESKQLGDVNPKVLVKKSAGGPWEVDLEAGPEFMRLSFMHSVNFTTDGAGKKLAQPMSVLVCGTGAWRSQPTGVIVFSRNDSTGQWTKTLLSANRWNREKVNHTTDVRCIWDHVDRVTGVHYVFAGSASGRIFRGVYDDTKPGLIAWDAKPELDDLVGHFLSSAEANGVQYVGVAYGPTQEDVRQIRERPVKDHGIFRRVDGPNARWEWVPVKEWEDPQQPGRSLRTAQLRGMTAVPAPDGKGQVLLVAWDTRDAAIERIDPREGFRATVELKVRDYISEQWGRPVGVSSFAYNDMLPVIHPDSGEKAHMIGLWVVDPSGEGNAIGKSSWYLVRYPDGTYRHQRIWDEQNPLTGAPYGLRGCRSIRPSPFPEEAGRVFYFCGFDQTGAKGAGATGPAAWIYKGTLPSLPNKKAKP